MAVAKKDNPVDKTVQAGKATFDFLQASFRKYGLFVFKISLVSFVLSIVTIALFVIIVLVAIGGAILSPEALIAQLSSISFPVILSFIILFILLTLIMSFVNQALSATMFVGTKEGMERRPLPSIIGKTIEKFVPATKYSILMYFIVLLAFGIPALALLIPTVGIFAFFGLFIIMFLILIVVFFLIQFSFWELILNRRGLIESLKISFALVKKNIIAVIVFDIVLFLVGTAVGSIFYAISYVLQFMVTPLSIFVPSLGIIASLVVSSIVGLLQGTVINVLVLPFTYKFWKSLR